VNVHYVGVSFRLAICGPCLHELPIFAAPRQGSGVRGRIGADGQMARLLERSENRAEILSLDLALSG